MPVDVSVVIPMFNAGATLEECLGSLLDQTLERERFEVLVVDDGSTDGSGARADGWARRHPDLITVHHLPASGGPARPRNVGIERATGRYIQFLDSDDCLGPRALERLLEVADESEADVVLPKLVCNFRGVHHPLFRRTVTRRTLADYPLMQNANVSKLVKREFLLANDIRFPEGPQYIEDTTFCLLAYSRARSVAVVGDTACYFYRRRRTGGRSYGETVIVPADYYRELGAMFDIVDTWVSPVAARIEVLRRFYRNEMLGRLRGRSMLTYTDDYRAALITEIQHLAKTRVPVELQDSLPMFLRTQSRLLLDSDTEGLVAYARMLRTIRLTATCGQPQWRDGLLLLDVEARLTRFGEPLQLERTESGWSVPADFAPTIPLGDRELTTADWADLDLDLATVSRADSSHWSTTDGLTLTVDSEGCPRVAGQVALDPQQVMGGAPLTTGLWDLRLVVRFGGLSRSCGLRPTTSDAVDGTWLADDGHPVTVIQPAPAAAIALDVGGCSVPLTAHVLAEQTTDVAVTDGELTVTLPRLMGSRGNPAAVPAVVILEPIDAPGAATVTRAAELTIDSDGSRLTAPVGDLPATSRRWVPWLRVGEAGGSPPRRLPIEIPSTG